MAELEVPPPYSIYLADLSVSLATILDNGDDLTPEEKLKFMGAMTKVMDDESKDKLLKDEMVKLNDSSTTIKNTFDDVSRNFQAVYDNATHEPFKTEVGKMKTEWDAYRTRFAAINDDAKTIAASASVIAKDYADIFSVSSLCNREKPVEKKKEEVEAYKQFIREKESESKKIKSELDKLIADVAPFNSRWQKVAEEEGKKLTADAKDYEGTIASENHQIESLTSDLERAIAALVLSGIGLAASIVAGFAFPMFWLGTVLVAALAAVDIFIMVRILQKLSESKGRRDTAQRKLDNLKTQQAKIDALVTGINSFNSESAKVILALGTFETLWKSLIADMDGSIKQLEEAAFAGGDTISLAYARIDTSQRLYRKSAIAFHEFSASP